MTSTWRFSIFARENRIVATALLIYGILQVNGIMFHGSWGQDFHTHLKYIHEAAAHPWGFLTSYTEGRTNPPLFHFLGGQVVNLTNGYYFIEMIALGCVAANVAGFYAMFGIVRRIIERPVLRLAAFAFLLFVPFAVIHAEVLAADALVTPLFIVYLYLVLRLTDPLTPRQFRLTLCLGMTILW